MTTKSLSLSFCLIVTLLFSFADLAQAQSLKPNAAAQVSPSAAAQQPEKPLLRSTANIMRMRSITNAQRRAAGQRARASRRPAFAVHKSSAALRSGPAPAVTPGFPFTVNPAELYFGGYPNYANSPLPVGAVGVINVSTGGAGYSASPIITVADAYVTPTTPAVAIAVVTGGVITSITVSSGGTGYIAPSVTINDTTGAGAAASAVLNPAAVSGGIHKFVETLPGLCGLAGATNGRGQCIPIAVADKLTYPDSDLYTIGLSDYVQQMHPDLPATHLRGYVDLSVATPVHQYLGPLIIAQRNRPVRVIFKNQVAVSGTLDSYGHDLSSLMIPKDSTYMGAGTGWNGSAMATYTDNRADLHLHGGATPWISDGTPHQWITPANDATTLKKGLSFENVPDMIGTGAGKVAGTAGDGQGSYYYTNQQSGRLMFYHDHSYGMTRLNVYAGEAGGYLLVDPAQETLLRAATVPGTIPADASGNMDLASADLTHLLPLVIQDRTFVDANTLAMQDPSWQWGSQKGSAVTGDLWFPHVYMPNQWPDNPDLSGTNPAGRWDYGPWFWPPQNPATFVAAGQPFTCTTTSYSPAVVTSCPGTPNPSGTPEAFMDTPLVNGTAYPVLHVAPEAYRFQILNASNDRTFNLQLYQAYDPATLAVGSGTEVKMVPAIPGVYPAGWPTADARDGGWPDPLTVGPNIIQIGTEGGLLPAPAVIQNRPVGYEYFRRSITVLNVLEKALMLGPAERADAVVDFSAFPNKTLILYNDAPTPVPAFDARTDYYTGGPDQTAEGGAPTTLPGYGPNIRTVMQIVVDQPATATTAFSLPALQAALPAIFTATQDPILVPEKAYGSATNTYSTIQATSLTYLDPGATVATLHPMQPKAIQELFTLDYGRMNATMGVELPFTNFATQTTIPYGYIDLPTEIIKDGETQIWKITHNGVDTHSIHFHLFTVQVLNRVGWDGTIKPPDANELSWKDTVRMNPLEDVIVAAKAVKQTLPWPIKDSIRPLDVTMPVGTTGQFTNIDPNNQPLTVYNNLTNFGWEYVWHCHLLGHEENDMMRPVIFQVPPSAPSNLAGVGVPGASLSLRLTWTDNSVTATTFSLQRANNAAFTQSLVTVYAGAGTRSGTTISFTDSTVGSAPVYYYRVNATSANGTSAWSATATVTVTPPTASVSPTSLAFGNQGVNTTSAAQTVTLTNTGLLLLKVTSITITGTNASNFAQTNSCSTITSGANCKISVTFKPLSAAALTASLVIASNDPAHPNVTVALTGTGTALATVPAAPTNLTATLSGQTTVNLAWKNNATNQTGYYVERSANGTTWTRVATLAANATSYSNTGLSRRTTYWFKVTAYNATGSSAYSNVVSITTM